MFAALLTCVLYARDGGVRNRPNASHGANADHRIRSMLYVPDQVVRLRGWVGYHVDLEFEPGESFVTLGAGIWRD